MSSTCSISPARNKVDSILSDSAAVAQLTDGNLGGQVGENARSHIRSQRHSYLACPREIILPYLILAASSSEHERPVLMAAWLL